MGARHARAPPCPPVSYAYGGISSITLLTSLLAYSVKSLLGLILGGIYADMVKYLNMVEL